jgi:arginase family enzyme
MTRASPRLTTVTGDFAAAGLRSGVRRALGRDVGIVHRTPTQTSTPPTTRGRLNGMAWRSPWAVAARLCAAGGPAPAAHAAHVALLGVRELDPGETGPAAELALCRGSEDIRRLGPAVAAGEALQAIDNGAGPVFVHFDVDVLDPDLLAAKDTLTPGHGLSWRRPGCSCRSCPRRGSSRWKSRVQPVRDRRGGTPGAWWRCSKSW